ncbi:Uncharacterised protein [Mycobacteroides abscessus subsp. abscessus]|nr:Uncharacterised protein [Mycobacteroides abscessus subsp. abscessus]
MATSTALEKLPIATANTTPTGLTVEVCAYSVPSTATRPKNTKTAISPKPLYP